VEGAIERACRNGCENRKCLVAKQIENWLTLELQTTTALEILEDF
jgi:hypothetical protein